MRTKRNPRAGGRAAGAEDSNVSPDSSAILDAVDAVCAAINTDLMPAKSSWRDGLALGSPRYRNVEYRTFVDAGSREGRRKMARMAKKRGAK